MSIENCQAESPKLSLSNPVFCEILEQVRDDLRDYLPAGVMSTANPVDGTWSYRLYSAAVAILYDQVPMSSRERAALSVLMLASVLELCNQLLVEKQRGSGLRVPLVPNRYKGGDSLLDSVLNNPDRDSLESMLRSALNVYSTVLPEKQAREVLNLIEPPSLYGYRVRPLGETEQGKAAYTDAVYLAMIEFIESEKKRPRPVDILNIWGRASDGRFSSILSVNGEKYATYRSVESDQSGWRPKKVTRAEIGKCVRYYCSKTEK